VSFNAVSCLAATGYNVTEISAIIVYDNALYFGRPFKKRKDVFPLGMQKTFTETGRSQT